MIEYKKGDIVNVLFKPKELNPYIIVDSRIYQSNPLYPNSKSGTNYFVRSMKLSSDISVSGFEVMEDEIELHILELRDRKLRDLGIV